VTRKAEEILNSCLEQMFQGMSINDCLNNYPDLSTELEPLLRTSLALRRNSLDIHSDSQFKARLRSQLQVTSKDKEQKVGWFLCCYRRLAITIASITLVLVIGGGTFFSSTNALPDEKLYPVKLAMEQLRLTLALSDMDKAKFHVEFAERRANEMVEMALQGESDKITTLATQIADHLASINMLEVDEMVAQEHTDRLSLPSALPEAVSLEATDQGKSVGDLEEMLNQSRDEALKVLRTALSTAPEALRPILEQAIENMGKDYNKVISIIGTG
jgi:hypothetical protein